MTTLLWSRCSPVSLTTSQVTTHTYLWWTNQIFVKYLIHSQAFYKQRDLNKNKQDPSNLSLSLLYSRLLFPQFYIAPAYTQHIHTIYLYNLRIHKHSSDSVRYGGGDVFYVLHMVRRGMYISDLREWPAVPDFIGPAGLQSSPAAFIRRRRQGAIGELVDTGVVWIFEYSGFNEFVRAV